MDPDMPPAWSFASTSTTWMPRLSGPGSRAERWPSRRWTCPTTAAAWRSRSTRGAASSACTRRVSTSAPPHERDRRAAVDRAHRPRARKGDAVMKWCSAGSWSRWRARRPTSLQRVRPHGGRLPPDGKFMPEGVPAHWMPYFVVNDVDAPAAKAWRSTIQCRACVSSTCPNSATASLQFGCGKVLNTSVGCGACPFSSTMRIGPL